MAELLLECCVDTLESAIAAQRGGADRLELCGHLEIGGVTPSPFLLEQVRKAVDIPVYCMVRPRFGDFCYTDSELALMRGQVAQFRDMGADGVVFGVLLPDGGLDIERMRLLRRCAEPMKVTLHRAFDMAADPMKALAQARELGIDAILTSGQRKTAWEGRDLLAKLHRAAESVCIMAGGGVDVETIARLYAYTGLRAYHMSGARKVRSPMVFRNPAVSMGLPSLSEYERRECDSGKVAAVRAVLDGL